MSRGLGTFDALERFRTPTHLAVDTRGGRAAFVTEAPGRVGDAVHVVDLASGHTVVHDGHDAVHGHLAFAADGSIIAARGLPDGELETVVAIDPITGAVGAEVALAGAIEDISPLPDGRWLVRTADPGSERDGMHLGTVVAPISGPSVDPATRWWRRLGVVDLATGRAEPLDIPGWTIWEATGDDHQVVAVASREPSPAGFYHPDLLRIDRSSGIVEVVHESDRQLARPRLVDGGRACIVVEGRSIVSGRLRLVDLATATSRTIDGEQAPADVTDLALDPDGRWWLAGWADHGSFIEVRSPDGAERLGRIVLDGTIAGRDAQPSVHPWSDDEVVAVFDTADAPAEVVRIRITDGRIEPLTALNDELADTIAPIRRADMVWTAADGLEIHGELLLPEHHDATDPALPLVVLVHGGPTWLWSRQYAPAESIGLALPLVHAGAAVLLPNPRGSSGRGLDFADAVAGEIGRADADDVLAGIDQLIENGTVDPDRLAVMGTSYGGYLASWLAARTDRFRATVAMSAVADWCSFVGTSAIGGGFDHAYFPDIDAGTPAGRELLASRSPAHHDGDISTPLLVLHGAADRITPVGQAHELAHAWRRAGADADVVIYPDEGHEPVSPRWRRDAARRTFAFLAAHGILE